MKNTAGKSAKMDQPKGQDASDPELILPLTDKRTNHAKYQKYFQDANVHMG